MKDKNFLQWIHNRLTQVHKENPRIDYMNKLQCIIDSYDANKTPPNVIKQEDPTMKPNQKLTPKYWVVHDKKTDDVFIGTVAKSMTESLELFFNSYTHAYSGAIKSDEELPDWFNKEEDLECILIEINKVM